MENPHTVCQDLVMSGRPKVTTIRRLLRVHSRCRTEILAGQWDEAGGMWSESQTFSSQFSLQVCYFWSREVLQKDSIEVKRGTSLRLLEDQDHLPGI